MSDSYVTVTDNPKFADAGGIDFARGYLEKMALNAHRFPAYGASPSNVLAISGPPGSGKTAIASALMGSHQAVYIERFENNPHLGDLQARNTDFDANASQRWFLDQARGFLRETNSPNAILDQDPTAIVLVYSRLLHDRGALSRGAYLEQLQSLLELETERGTLLAARHVVLLCAPADVLAARCHGKFPSDPDPTFLAEVSARFDKLYADLPNVVRIDATAPLDHVVAAIAKCASAGGPAV